MASSISQSTSTRDLEARVLLLEGEVNASSQKDFPVDDRLSALERRILKSESVLEECQAFISSRPSLPPPEAVLPPEQPTQATVTYVVDPKLSEQVISVASSLQQLDSKILTIERHVEALRIADTVKDVSAYEAAAADPVALDSSPAMPLPATIEDHRPMETRDPSEERRLAQQPYHNSDPLSPAARKPREGSSKPKVRYNIRPS